MAVRFFYYYFFFSLLFGPGLFAHFKSAIKKINNNKNDRWHAFRDHKHLAVFILSMQINLLRLNSIFIGLLILLFIEVALWAMRKRIDRDIRPPPFFLLLFFFSFDLSVRIFFCVCGAVNYFAIMPFEWQHSFELCTGDSWLGLSAATIDFFFFFFFLLLFRFECLDMGFSINHICLWLWTCVDGLIVLNFVFMWDFIDSFFFLFHKDHL